LPLDGFGVARPCFAGGRENRARRNHPDLTTAPDGRDRRDLRKRQNLIRFRLQTLSNDDCVALVAEKLSVRKIAKPVADLIVSKSQGNPFFSVEIAFALREHGLVLIDGDQCKPVSGVELATVRLPENIEGLIAQRVDALEREIQLVAKVASVIGMNFSVSLLRSVYPIADARPKVPQFLEVLASERLIQIDENNDFAFGHALVRDAVYDRLLGSQKQNLHALVGAELEQRHASDLESISPLLGYHWKKGGDLEKAAGFFGLAGQRAVLNGAYREGLGFLDDALAHSAQPQNSRGRWRRFRAEALLGLGRLGESSQEFRQAAEALGRPALEGKINRRLRQQVTARISLHLRGTKPAAVAAREQLRELAAILRNVEPARSLRQPDAVELKRCFGRPGVRRTTGRFRGVRAIASDDVTGLQPGADAVVSRSVRPAGGLRCRALG
jgi:predicted ATPase